MEPSLLADVFYFVMICAAIVIAAAAGLVAYHAYKLFRMIELLVKRGTEKLSLFEELIKKLPFVRKAYKPKRKTKHANGEE